MTAFDWTLVAGGVVVTVFALWAFALEYAQRRRPVRTPDGWRMPRQHPPYRGYQR